MTSETVNASGETSLLASDSSPVSNPSKVVQPDGQRSKLPVRLASIVGVAIAFALVLVWFPKTWNMWNMPIQAVDAPSHYYFIRKLLKNGLSVAFELNPNDSFYPPLFHILVYALIKLAGLFGISVNIFTGLNLVWLFTSGLVFPAGMLLWCSYFFSDLPRSYRVMMSLIVPILSVTSAAHPYWLFNAGPLFAYGLATSLLPFSLYAGLRLIDVLTVQTDRRSGTIIHWVLINLFLAILILLAHPRIAFTYLVFMVFFVLFKLPWKFIAIALSCCCSAAVLFGIYVMHRDHGKDYLHPNTWFHTFKPSRSISNAFTVLFTDYLSFPAGQIMGLCVCMSILIVFFLSGSRFRDGLALVCSFLMVGLIYICSASVSGTFANIVTAAWYRGDTRTLTLIPLALIPLLIFGARCILIRRSQGQNQYLSKSDSDKGISTALKVKKSILSPKSNRLLHLQSLVVFVILSALLLIGNVVNPIRSDLSSLAAANTVLDKADQHKQLTQAKFDVLTDIKDKIGTDAVIISDPMNGSMYGMALYGLNMLYPVYNPMDTKNGQVFGQVENAFASGESETLLSIVCTVQPSYSNHGQNHVATSPKYFLSMGPQASDLQFFTYKAQYDPFHDFNKINSYVGDGALKMVADYGDPAADGEHWRLYRVVC